MGSEVGHSIQRQQIPEYELERAFNRNCCAEGSMDKKSFVNAVTEILFKLGVEVTKEPSELDRALAGDKEAARKVLMGMGVIDRDGNLTENYAPLPVEATPEGEGRPVDKEKLCKEMLECLEWYIQEDDTNRGNCTEVRGPNWDEENEYWIKGQDKALDVCARARLGLGLTPKMEK